MSQSYQAFIFDLDGTIYLGDRLIPDADNVLRQLRKMGYKIRFVTNNPRSSRENYVNKLNGMGVEANVNEVMTSAWLTADYLKKRPDYGTVFMVGENQLRAELTRAGVELIDEGIPDTVLVSFDTTLTYKKLQHAYASLRQGANFITTNPDVVCPTPDGGLLDAGAIIAALEAATGREVAEVIGKPSPLLGRLLVDDLDVPAEECVFVGDRLNTDIRLGKQAGMTAIWIQASDEAIPPDVTFQPDYVIETIANLPDVLNEQLPQ